MDPSNGEINVVVCISLCESESARFDPGISPQSPRGVMAATYALEAYAERRVSSSLTEGTKFFEEV